MNDIICTSYIPTKTFALKTLKALVGISRMGKFFRYFLLIFRFDSNNVYSNFFYEFTSGNVVESYISIVSPICSENLIF